MVTLVPLLLWKNCIVVKRRWYFFGICFICEISWFVFVHMSMLRTYEVADPSTTRLDLDSIRFRPINIFYAPSTNFTDRIMLGVIKGVKQRDIELYPCDSFDEMLLRAYEYNATGFHVAVNFTHPESTTKSFPTTLAYDIWNIFNMSSVFYVSGTTVRERNEAVRCKRTTCIQGAIDKSFIDEVVKDNKYQFYSNSVPAKMSRRCLTHFLDDVGFILIQRNAALSVISFFVIRRVCRERASGGTDLLRISGVPCWSIWCSWLITTFLLDLIPCLFTSSFFYLLYSTANPSFILIYLLITLYCLANNGFFFFLIAVVDQEHLSTIACLLAWLFCHIPITMGREDFVFKMWTSLLPQMAVIWGYAELEEQDQTKCSGKIRSVDNWSFENSIGFLALDCVLFTLLAWLMDILRKGGFGREFPKRKRSQTKYSSVSTFDIVKSMRTSIEPTVSSESAAITIRDLTHKYMDKYLLINFSSNLILTGISMDIYKNEMTFIIASNEAGMSTFLSVATGTLVPSSGSVTVVGITPHYSWKIGLHIGICLQHDHFFPDLSVKENLLFFSMFRGTSSTSASVEADAMMQLLRIKDTPNVRSEVVRKKMCIGMALIGAPPVLLLDEPTTGIDAEARRDIWRVLNFFRGKRTILVTTKSTEEADIMADRIAILHQGQIQAYGTNLWLKRHFGSGYTLSMYKHEGYDSIPITVVVQKHVPEAKVMKDGDRVLAYNIPYERRKEANTAITAIDAEQTELGIYDICININTLEEIYKKISVAKDYLPDVKDEYDYVKVNDQRIENHALKKIQFKALVAKKVLYVYRFVIRYRFLGLITFIVHVSGFLTYSNTVYVFKPDEYALDKYRDIKGAYIVTGNVPQSMVEHYISILKTKTNSFSRVYKTSDLMGVPIGAQMSEVDGTMRLTALFGEWVGDMCWKSVNVLTNAALRSTHPNYNIIMHSKMFDVYIMHEKMLDALFFSCIGFVLILAYFPLLPMGELVSKTKRMQCLAGVSNVMYWSVCFVIDFVFYMLFIFVVIAIVAYANVTDVTAEDLLVAVLLLIVFGICAIPFTYVHIYIFKSYLQVITYISLEYFICLLMHFSFLQQRYAAVVRVLNFYPFFGIITAFLRLYMQMGVNVCVRVRQRIDCSKVNSSCCYFPSVEGVKPYIAFSSAENPHGIGDELLSLVISTIFISILFVLLDLKILQRFVNNTVEKMCYRKSDDIVKPKEDAEEVSSEEQLASSLLSQNHNDEYVLVMDSITKRYRKNKYSVRYFSAVNSVSLAVKRGDYFGLLGCNDAGKTVLVNLIVGDEYTDDGKLRLDCRSVGYCPQKVQLLPILTGYEILIFFAKIRGLANKIRIHEVAKLLKCFGLWEQRNDYVRHYNTTAKKKLGIAVAMIGDPEIVIMDSSLTGVDPITRWHIWETVRKLQKPWQAIIITSHILEESEEMYTKFAGMKNGTLFCLGDWKYLRDKYNLGLYLNIHLNLNPQNVLQYVKLKEAIEIKFENILKLKLERKRLLLFKVTDRTVRVTKLVNGIVELQETFPEIEDFSIPRASLSELFRQVRLGSELLR